MSERKAIACRIVEAALRCVIALLTITYALPTARADELIEARLPTPPHAPADAPDLIVHVPTRLDAQAPIHVLVFLHGFSSCARALAATQPTPCTKGGKAQRAYGLAQLHERAQLNSILLIPQLAFLERNADAKRFMVPGGFDGLLEYVRTSLLRKLTGRDVNLQTVTLLAHSAGYRAMATILNDRERRHDVHNLVLFDALYAHWDVFARWYKAAPERRIVSYFTTDPKTRAGNAHLRAQLRTDGSVATGKRGRQDKSARIVIQEVSTAHGVVPQVHMEDALRALFGAESAQ